jgi:hypothetical protein
MRKAVMLIGVLLISFLTIHSFAQKNSTVLLSYSFQGVVEMDENDLNSKCLVYADTSLVYESQEHMLFENMYVDFQVPEGTKEFKIVNYVQRNGVWEELTISNGFIFDGTFKQTIRFRKKVKIELVFQRNGADPLVKIR